METAALSQTELSFEEAGDPVPQVGLTAAAQVTERRETRPNTQQSSKNTVETRKKHISSCLLDQISSTVVLISLHTLLESVGKNE